MNGWVWAGVGVIALAVAANGRGAAQETAAPSAGAPLERIVVTAQKREQDLQDVPVSLGVIGGVRIEDTAIGRLEEAIELVPNANIVIDPIADKINIRGVQSGDVAGFEQSVSTFVDGVYRGRGVQSRFAFLDLDSVEVLRGPQGALFGQNTIGGAFNIRTAKPTPTAEFGAAAEHTFEGVEQLDVTAVASGPLTDHVRARAAVLRRAAAEGYVDNRFYGTTGPQFDEFAVRGSLEVDIAPKTRLNARAEYADFDVDEQPFTIIQAGPLAAFGVEASQDEADIGSINPVLDFGAAQKVDGESSEVAATLSHEFEAGGLTVIAAHSAYEFDRFLDGDFSPLDIFRFDEREEFEQTSLEIRFTSRPSRTLTYTLGGYAQTADLFFQGEGPFNLRGEGAEIGFDTFTDLGCQAAVAAGADPLSAPPCAFFGLITAFDGTPLEFTDFARVIRLDQTEEVWALFGSATYQFNEQWSASAGLRFTDHHKEAFQSAFPADFETRVRNDALGDNSLYAPFGVPTAFTAFSETVTHDFTPDDLSRNETVFTWSADLQYRPNTETMLFLRAATGFKAGGFNNFALGPDPAEAEFEVETGISYEAGARLRVAGGAAELNVTAFHSTFDDLQTAVFNGAASFIIRNAAEATSRGLEIDGRWAITDALQLTGALGVLDFEFDSFPNAGCTINQLIGFRQDIANPFATSQDCATAGVNDLAGRPNEHSPKMSASFGVRHVAALPARLRVTTYADVTYQSEHFVQADLDPVSEQNAFANLNLAVILGPRHGSWDVSLIGKNLTDEQTISFVNDTPLLETAFQAIVDRPRTVGIRLRVKR